MGLQRLDFLLHAFKGGHGGIGAQTTHCTLQLSLGLGGLGPGLEHVLLGSGLSNLALEGQEVLFQGLHLTALGIELAIERGGGLLVGLAAAEGFFGQILLTFFERQFGALIPGLRLVFGLLGLVLDAFLTGDRRGHGLAQLDQVRLHVSNGLLQDLDGVFSPADQIVQVGAKQTPDTIKQAHGASAKQRADPS